MKSNHHFIDIYCKVFTYTDNVLIHETLKIMERSELAKTLKAEWTIKLRPIQSQTAYLQHRTRKSTPQGGFLFNIERQN